MYTYKREKERERERERERDGDGEVLFAIQSCAVNWHPAANRGAAPGWRDLSRDIGWLSSL